MIFPTYGAAITAMTPGCSKIQHLAVHALALDDQVVDDFTAIGEPSFAFAATLSA